MKLAELLKRVPVVSSSGSLEVEVTGITADSRKAQPGSVFVAVAGSKANGAVFAQDAVKKGAVAVVFDTETDCRGAVGIHVRSSQEALADLAAAFYGAPAEGLKVAGVTGTNGKTTTAFLIQHICNVAQQRCGLVGTIHYQIGEKTIPAVRTTPDAVELQQLLSQMRDAGCRSVVMEVSSHAIAQQRVRGVDFDVAVFTNLTQDHLDYHGTMDAYFEAKAGFILGLNSQRFKEGRAVINADDRFGALLAGRAQQAGVKTVTFGFGLRADFRASNCRTDVQGSSFQLDAVGRSWLVRVPLSGTFNIANTLAALAAAHAMGVDVRTAVLALASAPPVPGRLEPVPGKRSFRVFVDYAHTDDALKNVLKTLRDLQPNRIISVFGCGGDRDRAKRPLMGAVAEEYSDWSIVTSDNPRSELPENIAREIESGMRLNRHEVILDRKAAIHRAVALAAPRDIVLIAGKGHEATQETAGRKEPFDDVAIAASAIEHLPAEFGR